MKKSLWFISLLLFSFPVLSQTVKVIDGATSQPLPGCSIYGENREQIIVTNAAGEAEISPLSQSDSIYFQFVNYQTQVYPYSQVQGEPFTVRLKESNAVLNEVVVSANRWEQEQDEVPYRIEKVNGQEIAFQNPQTAADLLGISTGAYIQKSQQAGGSPMLRGFATNRVMIVVDGVRMNNAIFRAGNLQNVISLDASSVEDAEVLFGPGAVMYGSDAVGGVMDFHTLNPQFASGEKVNFSGKAYARYSSANNEKTGHVDFNIGLEKWAFRTSFTHSDYDDLKAGSNGNKYFLRPDYQEVINGVDSFRTNKDPQVQVHSGYSQTNILQKISYKPTSNWDFSYAFHYSATSDAPRYDRLYLKEDDGSFTNAVWYYGPQKWMMNRLGIEHQASRSMYDKIRLVAALQNYEESRHDRKTNNDRLRNQMESVDALSINLDLDKTLTDRVSLFYGAEAVYNWVGSTANRININSGEVTPTNTRYPDGSTWQSYAVYGNLKYNISDQWILNAGARYSHFIIDAPFDTTTFAFPFTEAHNSNGALNGSLGIIYNPSESWHLYANASTGFRAPNIDDIGKVFDSEPGAVVVPNPDLDPEYAYNFEIGTARKFGNRVRLNVSAYYTFLDHALARRNYTFNGQDSIIYDGELSQVQAIQNITKAYIYGIQADVDINLTNGFRLLSFVNYQHGEEQSEDELEYYPLRHSAPTFGSTHLTYENKLLKVDFYGIYNQKMSYNDLALSERGDAAPYAKDSEGRPYVPGWYTLNLKAAWFINPNFTLNAGIENITDQLYRPYASGISAAGRNFIIAFRAQLF